MATERNTRIRASQISSILPNDLEATNAFVDNYVPSYDLATGKFTWVSNAGGVSDLADLGDVDFDSGTPVDDDIIKYDSVSGKWKSEALLSSSNIDDFTIKLVNNKLKIADRIENNIMLLAFYRAVDNSKSQYNLIDGTIDEYEDPSGIDSGSSLFISYNSSDDYYTNESTAGGIDSDTVLMLHCNGVDESTTFIDSSIAPHTVTAEGSAQIDTAVKKFGTGAGLFNGSTDYLTVPDSADWYFGTGDFVIDCWVWMATLPASGEYCPILSQEVDANHLWSFGIKEAGGDQKLYIFQDNVPTTGRIEATRTISLSIETWTHLAIVRTGTSIRFFKNAVQLGGAYSESDPMSDFATILLIGYATIISSGDVFFHGGIDELRVSKGTDRGWSSGFSLPTSEYSTEATFNDFTLISESVIAEAEPDNARIIIFEEDVDAVTLNTDMKAWVSKDGGSTWAQVTLLDDGDYSGSKRVLSGITDLTASGIGSGTSIKYKITSHNEKELKIHGTGMNWD